MQMKVLTFKLIYSANIGHLSFAQSSLYTNVSIRPSFTHHSEAYFLLFPSVRIIYIRLSHFWGLINLTQLRASEYQKSMSVCYHLLQKTFYLNISNIKIKIYKTIT
jgi:hypothetical protein